MIGASKILTVSYGTFSCTLEGFDDSFGTMKAIAEYFRDLAAEDRYFGAEPPTPDAEMLAKIAGHEIKRQVEAKIDDNGVVLRPIEHAIEVAEPVEQAAPVAEPAPVVESAAKEETASLIVPTNEYDDTQDEARAGFMSPEAPTEGDTESVAAKLRRIRAVVAKNQTSGTAASIFAEETDEVDEAKPEVAEQDDVTVGAESDADIEDTEEDTDLSAMMSRVTQDSSDDADGQDTPDEQDGADVKSAADEDEYEEDGVDDSGDVALANILETVTENAAVEDDTAEEDVAEAKDDIVEEDLVKEMGDVEESDAGQEMAKLVKPTRARVIKVKKPVIEQTDPDIQNDTEAALGQTNLSAEDEADLMAELADVELETPADTDSGIDTAMRSERANRALHGEGGAEDEASVSRLLDETNAQLETSGSTRRRSAISHLRAAVAATVAERKINPKKDADTADDSDAYRTDLAEAVIPRRAKAKGGTRKAHPAPLILVSEQRIDEIDTAEPSEPAATIHPRRIVKDMAPLHEVEIGLADLEPSDNSDDASDDGANIFADSTSFADFAKKMGAIELPDLLEAAAAYTAYVEGRPHFARPQIMRQVASFAGKNEFNREEGLRSFGQLLRQGKIIKIKRGQFEIADSTRFKPEARYAGE
ncbi:MAG: hypothetical protein COB39_02475 [Marinosulfonomonas sp.]|nr:MAG: hypothetical protein COB39_02475 [Marinosulfonomonas sp.]